MADMRYYAGKENGSGVCYHTEEDFFQYLHEQILEAKENGQEYFTVTIEPEPGGVIQ